MYICTRGGYSCSKPNQQTSMNMAGSAYPGDYAACFYVWKTANDHRQGGRTRLMYSMAQSWPGCIAKKRNVRSRCWIMRSVWYTASIRGRYYTMYVRIRTCFFPRPSWLFGRALGSGCLSESSAIGRGASTLLRSPVSYIMHLHLSLLPICSVMQDLALVSQVCCTGPRQGTLAILIRLYQTHFGPGMIRSGGGYANSLAAWHGSRRTLRL